MNGILILMKYIRVECVLLHASGGKSPVHSGREISAIRPLLYREPILTRESHHLALRYNHRRVHGTGHGK